MAYNREWDRGKDSWDNYDSWNEYPSNRGNVRGRDEDYYNEGKRRKYNHGVRGLHRPGPHSERHVEFILFIPIGL